MQGVLCCIGDMVFKGCIPKGQRVKVGGNPFTQGFGWLDSRTPLEGSTWDRIEGWVVVEGHQADSGVLALTNGSGTIVGFVDMGKPRPDVLNEFPDTSGLNGYSGYLDRSAASSDIFVVDDAFRCSTPLTSAVP